MNEETKKKIKALPQEVFYLLTADKAADLNAALIVDYDLDGVKAAAMVELVEKVYIKELRLAELYTQIKSLFTATPLSTGNFDETRIRQFVCDLAGYRFLPVSDWLGEDVANYIRSLGGNAQTYAEDNEELKKTAASELAADTLLFADEPDLPPLESDDGSPFNVYPDDPSYMATISAKEEDEGSGEEVPTSPEQAMEEYKNIITSNLSDLLETADHLFIAQFNYRLINLLVDHEDLKTALISLLLNNDLKIGTETIVLDGRQLPPTAGAWINYFISQKGSVMFDAVLLSDFLVNAPSAKFLSEADKARLSRLLCLYRNIKFFPDSLVGDNPEHWEILTYIGEPNYRFIDVDENIEKYKDRNIESVAVKQDQDIMTVPIVQAPAATLQVDMTKINALKQLAQKYAAGSLERLAIDEEITRLTTLK